VGQPVAGTELRIDPDTGEIQARGPQIMLGYLDRPADTARVIDADGWLHTGDVGELDEAGRLRITGRLKNLLILATGKNVAPAPIEDSAMASPLVHQAVLLGDGRDATGLLIVPDLEAIGDRADAETVVRTEVERLTAAFAAFERPRRVALLPRPLSRDLGEIDAAGRPVRTAVIAHFPESVAELFERSSQDAAPATGATAREMDGAAEHHPEPTATASG
jgi:long-chain acyl-CoA synthetase